MVRRVVLGVGALLVLLVVAGLFLPDDEVLDLDRTADTSEATVRTEVAAGTLADVPCPVDVTDFLVEVTCRTLTVPARRDAPGAGTVDLAVAVLHAEDPDGAPDPILYLAGGPGGPALTELEEWTYDPALAERDIVLLDQRGTGWSWPDLSCPELEEHDDAFEAERRCRERLEDDGIDLRLLRTAETAADVADLRVALGYETWNLWGSSYGSRVALTVLRDHPAGIRSVVLEGAYPHEVDAYADLLAGRLAALDGLADACVSDAVCRSEVGDVRGLLDELVRRFDDDPAALDDGTLLDGRELVEQVFGTLGGSATLGAIPGWLAELADGDTNSLEVSAERRGFGRDPVDDSPATFYVIECAEEVHHSTLSGISPQAAWDVLDVAEVDLVAWYAAAVVAETLASCEIWDTGGTDAVEDRPVTSDVPVLVFAGTLDPQTPPWWGRVSADALGNAVLLELPHRGHDTVDIDDCGRALFDAFLADPVGFAVTCDLDGTVEF